MLAASCAGRLYLGKRSPVVGQCTPCLPCFEFAEASSYPGGLRLTLLQMFRDWSSHSPPQPTDNSQASKWLSLVSCQCFVLCLFCRVLVLLETFKRSDETTLLPVESREVEASQKRRQNILLNCFCLALVAGMIADMIVSVLLREFLHNVMVTPDLDCGTDVVQYYYRMPPGRSIALRVVTVILGWGESDEEDQIPKQQTG